MRARHIISLRGCAEKPRRVYKKNIKKNITNNSVDKQYKNRLHIGLKALHFNKTANVTAAGNMNVHELCYLICVILMFIF